MTSHPPNAAQIDYWNGPRGEFWVREQELRDQELAFFGDAALRAAGASPGERVIDVGCGCGASSLALAAAIGPSGSVLGVDVSKPMLARAAERAQGIPSLRFELADAASFPFDGSAQLLFSRFGVMFFDDPPAAFANLRRALTSSGRLVFVCWRSLEDNAWMNVAFQALRRVITPVNPLPPRDAPGPLALADADRLRRILAGAGFTDVHLEPLTHPMPLGGNRGLAAAAADALTVGYAARLLKDASEETLKAALAIATDALAPYLRGEKVELDGAAWLVTARAG